MATGNFTRNPFLFRELAHTNEMRDALLSRAVAGAGLVRANVNTYGGPTWKRGVTRTGEFARMTFAEPYLTPSGWRSRFGSNAPWTAQVEYGTGKIKRTRRRIRNVSLVKRSTKVSLVKGRRGGGRPPVTYRTVSTSRRTRPQKGWSPKQRPIRKSLMQLRRV